MPVSCTNKLSRFVGPDYTLHLVGPRKSYATAQPHIRVRELWTCQAITDIRVRRKSRSKGHLGGRLSDALPLRGGNALAPRCVSTGLHK